MSDVHLTDEQLRRITDYVHPDETTNYVREWLYSMAVELLDVRARIAELEVRRTSTDDIRSRVLRRVLWNIEYHCSHTGPWDYVLDACPGCHRIATTVVDGLEFHGLLPTEVTQ